MSRNPARSVQRKVGGWACGYSGGDLRFFPASEFPCVFILWMKHKDAVGWEAIAGQGVEGFLDRNECVVDTEDSIHIRRYVSHFLNLASQMRQV